MKFTLGGYYRHPTGRMIHVLAECLTDLYGNSFLAESSDVFQPITAVGKGESFTVNWTPITREEWMTQYDPGPATTT